MSLAPKLTIGMPVFNGAKFLHCAIDSLLSQTFNDFELIISDNASDDQTQEICEHYAAMDPRVRYIRQVENLGAIANFNLLVELARGQYFKWAACDDICEPTYLQACVKELDTFSEVVWCHSDSDMVDELGESWLGRLPADDEEVVVDRAGRRQWAGLPRRDFDSSSPSKRFAGVLLGTRWCVDSYGVIRTNVLRSTGLYPNLYGAEKVLMGELSLLGKTSQIKETLFKQRIHAGASAYQDDNAAQQEFVSGRHSRLFASTRLRLFLAHLNVVRRGALSRGERLRCYVVLARYLFQCHKWMRVVSRAMRRKGVGGGGRRIIETATKRALIAIPGAMQ